MKQFLIGALILFAVLIVGAGTAGYFLIVKPATQFVGEVAQFTEEWQSLDQQIERRSEYTPPADNHLAEDQFARFLAAHRGMKTQLQGRLEALKEKYQAMEQQMQEEGGEMGISEIASAYRDMGKLILEAKRAQVQALNSQNFSLAEYSWVRNQTYGAIGQSVAVAAYGDQPRPGGNRQVTERSVKLVEPYREELLETHVLAWFGL